MKKFFISVSVVIFAAVGVGFMTPQTASAAPPTQANCKERSQLSISGMLSFPTWYRGFELVPSGDKCVLADDAFKGQEIGPIIFKVALNIIDIALRVIAIIAIGFVIFGGFRYVVSRGAPEETKKALDTILKAVVGMAIAMVSAVVVGFIVGRLGS